VDLGKLIELLMADKRNNPSNYALVIVSEGAEWEGYTVRIRSRRRVFGHRKKMSVAEDLSNEIKAAYRRRDDRERPDLRAALWQPGLPSIGWWLDVRGHGRGCDPRGQAKPDDRRQRRLLCLAADSRSGRSGRARWMWATMYNTERYRPTYDRKLGLPIFLTRNSRQGTCDMYST